MKKIRPIVTLMLLFVAANAANAQSALDKLILEDARNAYTAKNYKLCLDKIAELEQRGNKGLVIAHLKIMATSKVSPVSLTLEQVQQFKKDVNYYLENYDNEDFMQQFREVYEVSKTLTTWKYDEPSRMSGRASEFYRAKDYKSAMEWYLKAANQDYTYAQYMIGWMNEFGQGVEINLPEAIRWYRLAANTGQGKIGGKDANLRLGFLYEYGKGVSKDLNKALAWYTKNEGKNWGTFVQVMRVGFLYMKLNRTDEAEKWFTETFAHFKSFKPAIKSDIQRLRKELGSNYLNGLGGFPRDPGKAIIYYSDYLGDAEKSDNNLKPVLYFLAMAYELAGNDEAAYPMFERNGPAYIKGLYLYRSERYEAAFRTWDAASFAGGPFDQGYCYLFLAVAYFSGKGVEPDRVRALDLFTKADNKLGGDLKRYFYTDLNLDFFRTAFPNYREDEAKFVKFLQDEHGITFAAAPPRKPIVRTRNSSSVRKENSTPNTVANNPQPVRTTTTTASTSVSGPKPINGGILDHKAISKPDAVHSSAARAIRARGKVLVDVIVDENGNVISAKARTGHSLLRSAAVSAAKKAKFPRSSRKMSGILTYNFD